MLFRSRLERTIGVLWGSREILLSPCRLLAAHSAGEFLYLRPCLFSLGIESQCVSLGRGVSGSQPWSGSGFLVPLQDLRRGITSSSAARSGNAGRKSCGKRCEERQGEVVKP